MSTRPRLVLDDIHVGEVHHTLPDKLIAENHYLGSAPPGARHRYLITGGFRQGYVGAAMWGRPTARNERQFGQVQLTRYWTADHTPKNTESHALARMMQDMEQHGYDRLLTYASAARHKGGIYKATNWLNLGLRWPSSWDTREDRAETDGSPKWKYEYVFDLPGWSGDGRGLL